MTPDSGSSTHFGEKVIFVGLSEAGKTAIRDLIFGGKATEEVEDLSATINYIRQIVTMESGRMFTLMDLGGQRVFLERFLNQFSPFVFHRVKALIFVLDVSVEDRFESAKAYFDHALTRLKERSPEAKFFVLLHKIDLLQKESVKLKTLHYLRTLFRENVDTPVVFFETSIYDGSIKRAVDEIVRRSFPLEVAPVTPTVAPAITTPLSPPRIQPSEVLESHPSSSKPLDIITASESVVPLSTSDEIVETPLKPEVLIEGESISSGIPEVRSSSEDESVTFTAAEQLVAYLEQQVISLDLSYLGLFGEGEEVLIEIGDRLQYFELINELYNAFNSQFMTDPASADLRIVETEKFILLAQPLQISLILILAGSPIIKTMLLEKMTELRTSITELASNALQTPF